MRTNYEMITESINEAVKEWNEYMANIGKDIDIMNMNIMQARLDTPNYLQNKEEMIDAYREVRDAMDVLMQAVGKCGGSIDKG